MSAAVNKYLYLIGIYSTSRPMRVLLAAVYSEDVSVYIFSFIDF